MIIYFEGFVNERTFSQTVSQKGINPDDKNVVLIFPGNAGHHGDQNNLFSIKGGTGLGVPASTLGSKGHPVLSLPTTSMGNWSTRQSQQQIVQGAIEDLYRAVGAGFHLCLPVRGHVDTTYFDNGLADTDGVAEPSFWGETLKTPNKPLAQHYITELDKLAAFLDLSEEEQLQTARSNTDNPLYTAYLDGLQMDANDPWLKKPTAPQSRPVETTGRKDQQEPLRLVDDEEDDEPDFSEGHQAAVRSVRQVFVEPSRRSNSYLDMLILGSLYTFGFGSLAIAILAFPVIAPALAAAGYIAANQVTGLAITLTAASAYSSYKFFQSARSTGETENERIVDFELGPNVL